MENNYNEWENNTQQTDKQPEVQPEPEVVSGTVMEDNNSQSQSDAQQSERNPYDYSTAAQKEQQQNYQYQEQQTQQSNEQHQTYQHQSYQQQSYGQQESQYYRNHADYSNIPVRKKGKAVKIVGIVVAASLAVGLIGGVGFAGANYLKNYTMNNNGASAIADNSQSSTDAVTISTAAPVSSSSAVSGDVSAVVEEVMPCIVSISSKVIETTSDLFGQQYSQESEGSGSGIIVSQDSKYLYIVTNNHVVEDSEELSVKFVDDTVVTAQIKGTDADADLAVVVVPMSDISDETAKEIKVATMGDSDAIKVGQPVIAIGNALGYGQSVTTGIISAKERDVELTDKTMKLLQTNAAINPGNSGGALLNSDGQVIGINSVKYASSEVEGMGFAIPIAMAKPIIEDLINERVIPESQQAALGIVGLDIDSNSAEGYGFPKGVYVRQVMEDSAAEKAGIKFGDIITKFDNRDVSSMESLSNFLTKKAAGDKVEIVVMRQSNKGQYKEVKLTVTLQKKVEQSSSDSETQDGSGNAGGNSNKNGNSGSNGQLPGNGDMDDIMEYFRQYFGY